MAASVRRLILKIVADLPEKERKEREQRAAAVRDRITSRRVDNLDKFEEQLCVGEGRVLCGYGVPTKPCSPRNYLHFWTAETAREAIGHYGYGTYGDVPPHMSLMMVAKGGNGIFSGERTLSNQRAIETPPEEAECELRIMSFLGEWVSVGD